MAGQSLAVKAIALPIQLTFLGFVWPGWLRVLSTPGDVEMLTMAVMTAVGIIGCVVFSVGAVGSIQQKRSEKGEIEAGMVQKMVHRQRVEAEMTKITKSIYEQYNKLWRDRLKDLKTNYQ
ncbi:MAG: hypothetical protein SFV17_20085 [Candidatus Obscuribacter sp.]|nr:hypothetical protein [Candidatus Obscuribacter sp.]